MKIVLIFLIIFLLAPVYCLPASRVDSLLTELKTVTADTQKVNIYIELSAACINSDPGKAIKYALAGLDFSKKVGYFKGVGLLYSTVGGIYYSQNKFSVALENYFRGLEILDKFRLNRNVAEICNSIGVIYYYQANYEQALHYFTRSLKKYQEFNNQNGIASAYNNIGLIYQNQENYEKSLEFHFKSLKLNKEIKNKRGEASSYNNIGEIYRERRDYEKALDYYFKSLKIKEEISNQPGIASTCGNIGTIYQNLKKFDIALEYHLRGLKIREDIKDSLKIAESYNSLGAYYNDITNYAKAINYFSAALAIGKKVGVPEIIKESAGGLAISYNKLRCYEQAYNNQVLFKEISDSIYNMENTKKIMELEMQNEFELRQRQQQFEQKKRELEFKSELKNQKIITTAFIIGFGLMFILAFVIYRSFRDKNKINKLLEQQKIEIIEEKRKSDKLLLNILPYDTAKELKLNGKATVRQYDTVTVLFTDFKGFTRLCELLQPIDLIAELDRFFAEFDSITENHTLEKIKTVGDAYLCAGGVPVRNSSNPFDAVLAGLQIQQFMNEVNKQQMNEGKLLWQLRLGIHTGPVVAGVVGKNKFAYDIWGDTVNIASRMEESGEPGKVNITGATHDYIKDYFVCTHRGKISAKNKGDFDMYFVERIRPEFSKNLDGTVPNEQLLQIMKRLRPA